MPLTYRERHPHSMLRGAIRSFWLLKSSGFEARRTTQRFPADGGMELIISLHAPFTDTSDPDRPLLAPRACLSGARSRTLTADAPRGAEFCGVRFHPGGGAGFFGIRADEITDGFRDIEDLPVADRRALRRCLGRGQGEADSVLSHLEGFFLQRFKRLEQQTPVLQRAVALIHGLGGQITIDQLSDRCHCSARHLERLFRAQVGVTPKRLCRIVRFHHAVKRLHAQPPASWADAALVCGFCDQAHLIRDFKYFCGESPLPFLNNRMSEFFNTM